MDEYTEKALISKLQELPRDVLASYICKTLLSDLNQSNNLNEKLEYQVHILKEMRKQDKRYDCPCCSAFMIESGTIRSRTDAWSNLPYYFSDKDIILVIGPEGTSAAPVHIIDHVCNDDCEHPNWAGASYMDSVFACRMLQHGVKCKVCSTWTCGDCYKKTTIKHKEDVDKYGNFIHKDFFGIPVETMTCKLCVEGYKPIKPQYRRQLPSIYETATYEIENLKRQKI